MIFKNKNKKLMLAKKNKSNYIEFIQPIKDKLEKYEF